MTHFDFKTLLPALLQVEDRMSMAHGLESRVPFLDHKLIELAATIPADIKFKNGELKRLLVRTFDSILPNSITQRKDKMGFPVPLNEWMQGELKDFICGIFETGRDRGREFFNTNVILDNLSREGKFSRKIWGLLSLEVWMQEFHDKSSEYKKQLIQERLT
jgi:asparagine synthase (glutamine-hydrolysing)